MADTATIYGIRNCDTMKKARRWLDEHGVACAFHDYRADGIDKAKLERWAREAGWEKLLNRAGTTFRKLPPADTSADNLHEVAKLGLIARVEDYTDMIRFRNFLVHRYESVETEIVYDIVKNKLDTLDRFLSEISAATEN